MAASRDAIQNCLRGMREAVEDWEVDGFERYEADFEAVDEKDRHVAAAAFKLSSSLSDLRVRQAAKSKTALFFVNNP